MLLLHNYHFNLDGEDFSESEDKNRSSAAIRERKNRVSPYQSQTKPASSTSQLPPLRGEEASRFPGLQAGTCWRECCPERAGPALLLACPCVWTSGQHCPALVRTGTWQTVLLRSRGLCFLKLTECSCHSYWEWRGISELG